MTNPTQIDNIYEFLYSIFNAPRCKTAILIITIILTLVYGYLEITKAVSQNMISIMTVLLGFWIGRTSKKEETLK